MFVHLTYRRNQGLDLFTTTRVALPVPATPTRSPQRA
jgi:hypothetical protein